MTLTLDLSLVAECSLCGRRYDLVGMREVTDVDDVIEASVVIDGPCPRCAPPDDGGGEVTAAE